MFAACDQNRFCRVWTVIWNTIPQFLHFHVDQSFAFQLWMLTTWRRHERNNSTARSGFPLDSLQENHRWFTIARCQVPIFGCDLAAVLKCEAKLLAMCQISYETWVFGKLSSIILLMVACRSMTKSSALIPSSLARTLHTWSKAWCSSPPVTCSFCRMLKCYKKDTRTVSCLGRNWKLYGLPTRRDEFKYLNKLKSL